MPSQCSHLQNRCYGNKLAKQNNMKDSIYGLLGLISKNKLKLHETLQKKLHLKYFSCPTNPGEQYQTFLDLSRQLLTTLGIAVTFPSDDPNLSAIALFEGVKLLGFNAEFNPSKLLPGWGPSVESILRFLIEKVNETPSPTEKPLQQWPITEIEIEELVSDSDDDIDESLEEDVPGNMELYKEPSEVNSNFKEENWLEEVERANGKLKSFFVQNDTTDWRNRLAAIRVCRNKLVESNTDVMNALEKFSSQLASSVSRVEAREVYLNNQLAAVVKEFQECQDELVLVREKFKEVGGGITSRNETIQKLDDQIAKLKQQLEERGQAVTDGGSVLTAQKALQRIQKDLMHLNVRLGVAQHLYIQGKLKDAQKK